MRMAAKIVPNTLAKVELRIGGVVMDIPRAVNFTQENDEFLPSQRGVVSSKQSPATPETMIKNLIPEVASLA